MKKILVISSENIEKKLILTHLEDVQDVDIVKAVEIEGAENYLFEDPVCLIIIDWNLQGAKEFTSDLKSDEMFRMLPVIAIISDESNESIQDVFLNGADNYVFQEKINWFLPLAIRPLIGNNVLNDELVRKVSSLQEKAIHNFILLDLIKKYIPRTIWTLANDFAYEQKIHIPEEELELTIAFGDIKEFTPMAEQLAPIDVIKNLNTVFEIVTDAVFENNGDIDKFIGDAFLAVFVNPEDAIRGMVLAQKELEKLNENRKREGLHEIQFRIGIHTGPVIRGNVGGNKRYDNTLIGDSVNTAARLESQSLPGDILISRTTKEKAALELKSSKQSSIRLKGKTQEVVVYQIFDELKDKY